MATKTKEFAKGLLGYQEDETSAGKNVKKKADAPDDQDMDVSSMSTDELIAMLRGL